MMSLTGRSRIVHIVLLILVSVRTFAEERFPPPQFTTHKLPEVVVPAARAEFLAYVDVAALLVALGLGAYFSLYRRSRAGIFALMLASIAYFGFYRHGCVCSIGAIQNIALGAFDRGYAVPFVVAAFFLLPLLFALFYGRVFCAGVCPLGALQDLVLFRPLRTPLWLDRALGVVPFLYLGFAVLFAASGGDFFICRYDPFISFFRLAGPANMFILGAIFLVIGVVVGRPYCRFLCPYGALLRLLGPLSWRKVAISPGECVDCKLCHDACPYGAIMPPTPADIPRKEGKAQLAIALVALPILLTLGGWLGLRSSGVFANLHPTVRLAGIVWQAERGNPAQPAELYAFNQLGIPAEKLYEEANALRGRFAIGSAILGGGAGLVIGMTWLSLLIRRRRTRWEADAGLCFACGRCYRACPVGKTERHD